MEPDKPDSKTYQELLEVLKQHYEPKPVVIAERFRFYRWLQAPGESFASYVAELKNLARNCAFEGYLETALRDQFVCGIRSQMVQKHLLRETDLTFKLALEVALSVEAAEKHSTQLNSSATPTTISSSSGQLASVNKIANSKQPQRSSGFTGQSKPKASHNASVMCHRCGGNDHASHKCRFLQSVCHNCNKRGHLAKVCRSKRYQRATKSTPVNRQHHIVEEETPEPELPLFHMGHKVAKPLKVTVHINDVPVAMEVDTGAAMSVMTSAQQQKIFPNAMLNDSSVVLKTYTAEQITVHGEMSVHVTYLNQSFVLPLLIVNGDGPALLGRNWLEHLRLDWPRLAYTPVSADTQSLLDAHQEVFKDELGTVKDTKISLTIKPDVKPSFHRPRPVPLAIRDAVAAEIDRLEKVGILEKVDHSEWATPIVPVPKKDGSMRICGDYKVTVNAALEVDQHPLPTADEIFASLAGGQKFTKLDLSQAYQQLLLDDKAKELLTINTHKGLYCYTRLPFGIASAPAIFQRTMDRLLQGIDRVMCYIDDIIITGRDDTEHLHALEVVLNRLQEKGFRLKRSKCLFMGDSVEFLGHRIDAQGLHPTADKLAAIKEAPPPGNVSELRAFLGMLNYYGKFIPSLASTVHPLNQLLQKDQHFIWTEAQEQAFEHAKQSLLSTTVLAHYNSNLPLFMAADASAYGVGAVISHVYPNGTEKPIAFASRTLSHSERNYTQLEKEALALVFGLKKFHKYLYGRKFTLITDHKPLTTILHPNRCTPPLAAARLQRWALILSAYQYEILFKPTAQHANADGLSRLPLQSTASPDPDIVAASCFNMSQIASLPITAQKVATATRSDPLLSKVITYVREGWPNSPGSDLKPFAQRENELTVEGDCLLWGTRVVVPGRYRDDVLKELHTSHSGMSRTKSVARSYVWWPGIDQDIEKMIKACQDCQSVKNSPPAAPVHPWVWPSRPWERIHIDFAGPFQQKSYFLVMDAHSKWPEIFEMTSTTTDKTVAILRSLFSHYGLPRQIVSDNGAQFTSSEFAEFIQSNGIKHTCTAPYHPASNGAVERLVQSFKQAMKASLSSGRSSQHRLDTFLMEYRNTPHSTTGEAPSTFFLGRRLRTRLDILRPSINDRVRSQQTKYEDRRSHATVRSFEPGDPVCARDFLHSGWKPGTINKRTGPLSYEVLLGNGQIWRRHVDHVKSNLVQHVTQPPDSEVLNIPPPSQANSSHVSPDQEQNKENRRYPQRLRKPTERYTS